MTEETSEKVNSSEKSTSKARDRTHKWDKVKVLKKVIIRRLPPSMTEEIFLKQIEPLPDHENYYFVPADWSLGQDATARAYINFVNQDDIFLFKDRFDGYVFVDNKGAEYPAVVEFAPFQGMPRNKSRKKDPKAATIESDPQYISFLETLNKDESEGTKAEFKLEYSFQLKDDKKITSTPLLQYLANKKQERRDERKRKIEERRRQREEERTRMKTQVTTIKAHMKKIAEEDSKEDEAPKEKVTDKKRDRERSVDDRKDSRNRRRDQKRKEERERRALESRASNTSEKSENKLREEEDIKKKESKKYSLSRREKQRTREENRRAEASTNAEKAKDSSTSQPSTPSVQSATPIVRKSSANEEINENVLEFITSCKEFIPRSRSISASATLEGNKSVDTESGLAEVRNKLQQLSTSKKDDNQQLTEKRGEESTSKSATEKEKEREKRIEERNARRIRNKDRPSIEIYQPRKMRLSSSTHKDESGRSSTEMRDYKSNPTSDCESIKQKDEKATIKKKVSRYSERRSGRAKERLSKDVEVKEEIIAEAAAVDAEAEGDK